METFAEAIFRFNSIGNDALDENSDDASETECLRYTWPLFLEDRKTNFQFWSGLKLDILSSLRKQDILWSRAGTLCRPKNLFYIPLEYRLDGEPLAEQEDAKSNHLSFLYDLENENMLGGLKAVGVSEMTFNDFYEELRQTIDEGEDYFLNRKSAEWHSKIASLFVDHATNKQALELPLVPLCDGRWVTAGKSHLFLNRRNNNPMVPRGIKICLVDDSASQDENRKEFFNWLGIKKCKPEDVCRMIMELHLKKSRARRLEDWVSDAIYLFRTLSAGNELNEILHKLRLAESNSSDTIQLEEMFCGDRLYLDVPGRFSFIEKFVSYPAKITGIMLVHPMYLEEARKLGLES